MELEGPLSNLFAWINGSHPRLKRLRRLRPAYVLFTLVTILLVIWYIHGGWRMFYVNHTPPTHGGDAAISIVTDHSTYLNDEGLVSTITNHLSVPIYTHATPLSYGVRCAIDLYVERRNDSGRWISYRSLGVEEAEMGEWNPCGPVCSGTAPAYDRNPPPPVVITLAPGASYTQHWVPNDHRPTNDPGAYRLVFRYSTAPYAAGLTRLDVADTPDADTPDADTPDAGTPGAEELAIATSSLIQVVDDGFRSAPYTCTAA